MLTLGGAGSMGRDTRKNRMDTPVALLVFNRPDVTAQVFARIAAEKPRRLLVVADGPRPDRPGEAALCAEVRRIVTNVDWDCELLTDFADRNLGCGLRVSSGLDWVFRTVERAIVLEDDCLPSPDFFRFCEAMLERYADDPRIGMISGDYFLGELYRPEASYFFSRFTFIWGWATWRRSWRHYDWTLSRLPAAERERVLENLFDRHVAEHWRQIFRRMRNDPHFTWDYQLSFSLMTQGLVNIVPSVNLVSNIGFARPDATHTPGDSPFANLPCGWLPDPLVHPEFVAPSREADRLFARHVYGIAQGPVDAAPTLLNLANELLGQGRQPEAETLLNQALACETLPPEGRALAGVTAWRLGRAEAAFGLLAEAAAQRPDDWTINGNLGHAALALGRMDEARAALERAVAANGDAPHLHLGLASALAALGDGHAALRHQRRGVALDPANAEARQALEQMERRLVGKT